MIKNLILSSGIIIISLTLSGCFVGETAAVIVQAPFEAVDVVVPGTAGEVIESTGETAAWITDFIIPF